jgi:hypothetical protein
MMQTSKRATMETEKLWSPLRRANQKLIPVKDARLIKNIQKSILEWISYEFTWNLT